MVACEMGLEEEMRRGLTATVIASIGPTTSEEVERPGPAPDMAASHPKMGVLVREAAEQSGELLLMKRPEGHARGGSLQVVILRRRRYAS